MKTKDEANAMVRRWIADIADIRDLHGLEIRRFAGELARMATRPLQKHLDDAPDRPVVEIPLLSPDQRLKPRACAN